MQPMTAELERVGFVGIGNMGVPMTANIAKAGYKLTLYDIDRNIAEQHANELGCGFAANVAELAKASDIIITMLPTGQIVHQLLLEPEGNSLSDHMEPGSLLIDMGSSDPVGTRALGPLLSAKGVSFVDAPVSGAVPRAISGTLAIMIGGNDPAAILRAKPLLATMGDRLFETGSSGSGHAMKALNNYVAAAGFAAASEALIIGQRFGLDPAIALDILNVSTGRNFSTELTIGSQVLTGRFASGFALGLLAKDVKAAADLAESLNMSLPLVAETDRWWRTARDELGGEKDHTSAFAAWKAKMDES